MCLRPDLVREYEQIQQRIADARENAMVADSMIASADVSGLQVELDSLEQQMRDATVIFVLRALPRPEFRTLWAQHPPRRGDDDKPLRDDIIGVNTLTFWPVLIRASTVSPELDEETWGIFLNEKLSDRQFFDFASLAFDLSQERVDLPFSFNA